MFSVVSCGFDPAFLAESAANGETVLGREAEGSSALRASETIAGLPGVRGALELPIPASLSSCSIGNKRWA